MSKRFIDTGIWEKPWFRKFSPVQKNAWIYLLHHCDYVGVWDADFDLADFTIGAKVDWDALKNECNKNIEVLENGKWWIVDYCKFNYGDISDLSKSSLQRAVHSRLIDRGLWDKYLAKEGGRVRKDYAKTTRSLNSNSNSNSNRKSKSNSDEDSFAAFWKEYPRKVNKVGARKAWAAREKDGTLVVGEVMAAVAAYTKQMAGREVQFVMHPTTFLGPALRWKDYLIAGSKYVPAAKADDDLSWVCGGCGEKYRSTSSVCRKCGWEKV